MDEPWSLLLLAACALLYWYVRVRRWNLRIVVEGDRIDVQGRALAGRQVEVVDFCRLNLAEVRRLRVEGFWDGRYLRLRFWGFLTAGQRQRIRNFLMTVV